MDSARVCRPSAQSRKPRPQHECVGTSSPTADTNHEAQRMDGIVLAMRVATAAEFVCCQFCGGFQPIVWRAFLMGAQISAAPAGPLLGTSHLCPFDWLQGPCRVGAWPAGTHSTLDANLLIAPPRAGVCPSRERMPRPTQARAPLQFSCSPAEVARSTLVLEHSQSKS